MLKNSLVKLLLIPGCGLSLGFTSGITSLNASNDSSYIYVTYDAGKGTFDGVSSKITIATKNGTRYSRRSRVERPEIEPIKKNCSFKEWTYNGEAIPDDFALNGNVTFTASYDILPPTGDWDNDSWAQIASASKQGYDNLQKVYKKDTFLGLTKKVEYKGLEYTARVIGENHDDLADSTTNEKACLTFEVVELIDGISYSTETINSNVYETSNIRRMLNEEIINYFDSDIAECARSVKKVTHKGGGGSKVEDLITTNDKLFALSLKEMDCELQTQMCASEGNTYAYYSGSTSELRKKNKKGSDTPSRYWLRSPEVETKYFGWDINENGDVGDDDPTLIGERKPQDVRTTMCCNVCFAL